MEEIEDQAGLMGDLRQAHLLEHGGKIDPNCGFCKWFIISGNKEYPLESYKMVFIDFNQEIDEI